MPATATITAKYVNPPKPGRTNYSIKTPEDELYWVDPRLASQFQPGGTYQIEYDTKTFGDRPSRVITRVVVGGAAPEPPPPQSYGGYAHPQSNHTPAPRTNGNGHRAPNGDAKAREMFIMGVVGRAMGSGKFEPHDISQLTNEAASAWDALQTWGEPR